MEKKHKPYDEANLIRIEGKGLTADEICSLYIMRFKNGFDLTVEEIADYLRCTYQYVLKNITSQVPHIRITEDVKILLLKREDDEFRHFYYKRILFDRKAFQDFIIKNATYIRTYKRFYQSDFSAATIKEIKIKLEDYNRRNTKLKDVSFERLIKDVLNSFMTKYFVNDPCLQQLDRFPKLQNQNDIMDSKGLQYKVSFYRYVESVGLNKIKLGNLVRYDVEEVNEKDYVCSTPIKNFENLMRLHEGDIGLVMEEIKKKALQMLD